MNLNLPTAIFVGKQRNFVLKLSPVSDILFQDSDRLLTVNNSNLILKQKVAALPQNQI